MGYANQLNITTCAYGVWIPGSGDNRPRNKDVTKVLGPFEHRQGVYGQFLAPLCMLAVPLYWHT